MAEWEVMEQDLQGLLDRIKKDGIDKAEAQAAEIVAAASEKARAIVEEAESTGAGLLAKAEADSQVFAERSRKILEQAARDFLIGVQRDLEALLQAIVANAVGEALTPDTMAEMMIRMAQAYGENEMREDRLTVLLSPADQRKLIDLVMGRFREELRAGIEIHPSETVHKGFKVTLGDGKLYHDFTQQAISDSVSELLKSPLKEIVAKAAEAAEENA